MSVADDIEVTAALLVRLVRATETRYRLTENPGVRLLPFEELDRVGQARDDLNKFLRSSGPAQLLRGAAVLAAACRQGAQPADYASDTHAAGWNAALCWLQDLLSNNPPEEG